MKHQEIKNLRKAIESILKEFPKARDSDQWLTLKIWQVYFPDWVVTLPDGTIAVRFRDIMNLPREDNVKRIRAKIQNEEGKWLPTTWKIAHQRKIEESVWRNYVNYN